jgi:hypothetical protein
VKPGTTTIIVLSFTPHQWWSLGRERIVWEIQQVYKNFVHAVGAPRTPSGSRRAQGPLEPEVAASMRR